MAGEDGQPESPTDAFLEAGRNAAMVYSSRQRAARNALRILLARPCTPLKAKYASLFLMLEESTQHA